MAQPDPDLVRRIIDSRPQMPPQILGSMPVDKATAIALMPADMKLQVAELVVTRMARAYGLTAVVERDTGGMTVRIDLPDAKSQQ